VSSFSFVDKFLAHVWCVPDLEGVNHELSQFLEPKDKKRPLSPNEKRRTGQKTSKKLEKVEYSVIFL
jgi:hypothetical protein